MKKKAQPAKVSYFFGPGWNDLKTFIKKFWEFTQEDIKKRAEKVEKGKGVMSLSGAASLLSCFSLILFGSLFFLAIAFTVSLILGLIFLLVYILFFLLWISDRIHLIRNKIFVACPSCKSKYFIPTYICPSCGARHSDLTPGKYGAFFRTCQCGKKLPAHFLLRRDRLEAECPNCGHSLSGTGNRPLCVPIIGGRSSGKTAFITAFSCEFIERVAPRNGMEIQHYNKENHDFYEKVLRSHYLNGTSMQSKEATDIKAASSVAFSFMVHHKKMKPDRLIQIYDIAGETFVNNTENELQLHYTYSEGIVFVLDPLSIPSIRNRLDEGISEVDKSSVGTLDVDLVLDSFLNKLRQITGHASGDALDIPIAVVISKADIRTVDEFIGDEKISAYLSQNGLDMNKYTAVEDRLCREFLTENGMAHFVNAIDMKFKNNRYFKCSAIGHSRERGRYNPKGVLEPMEWIFQTTDNGMKSIWHETKFDDF